ARCGPASRARDGAARSGRHARRRTPLEPRACLRRQQAARVGDRARQRTAPPAHRRADRRHGAARAQRPDRPGQAPRDRAQDLGAVHRAFDGRRIRLRGPHHRDGARPADRRRRREIDPRESAGARGLFRHRQGIRAQAAIRPMSGEIILETENLSAWYGAARILYDLKFHVRRGEVVALMGRNGAGKSTTMKAIMGLLPRRTGCMRFNGRDVSRLEAYRIARLGLGFTPEDRRIFSDLTVIENLDVGRQEPRAFADGVPAPCWTTEKLFALFPNLADRRDHLGSQLSGGEQQMLTVARTLMGNPLLVLLDEPSEGVAPLIVEQMANTIVELKEQGLSVLLSEQNLHFAALVSDRVYLLEKGHIVWEGGMVELAENTEVQRSFLTM